MTILHRKSKSIIKLIIRNFCWCEVVSSVQTNEQNRYMAMVAIVFKQDLAIHDELTNEISQKHVVVICQKVEDRQFFTRYRIHSISGGK